MKFQWSITFILLFLATATGSAQTGVEVSKTNVYSVVGPPQGVSTSKTNIYSVVGPPKGVSTSKVNVYVVVAPLLVQKQPSIIIITQKENEGCLDVDDPNGIVHRILPLSKVIGSQDLFDKSICELERPPYKYR